ncbi:MAG TPA: PQQ-binding-like beta-propeller repeat protein [Bryobacteraceae bacterium]|nr:PQQ-binding-like beta-propeller repeat protein [Bryobacteraceae bacterium]
MIRFLSVLLLALSPAFAQIRPCASAALPNFTAAQADWNGWGVDLANSRFQPHAQLTAAEAPRLKLKWAFGFSGVKSVMGQPSVVGGSVFLGVDTGAVYRLDAASGCLYWTFMADAAVRTAITIERVGPRSAAFFGDLKANAYAIDATTGELLWKAHVDDHPSARITGAPKVFEGRVYVPVASGEEGAGVNPKYPCCTFRGSVVALDAATGKRIWKTYMIAEEPKPAGKNTNGVERFAPAGAGIWSSPTIDARRRALYVGTGDAYTEPAAKTTDAIVALDLDSGKILWSVEDTENDAWLAGCQGPFTEKRPKGENCPKEVGPDHDFGSPPMLVTLAGGRTILVAGQKSGNVWAHDPDKQGAVLWRTALVKNTKEFGGKIVWGGAADEGNAYFGLGTGGVAAVQLKDGERKWFVPLEAAPGLARLHRHDGPLTAIPGAIFSGGWDGVVRALAAADGHVLWEYNTVHDYETVNGIAAKGGSIGAAGPAVARGMLFVPSGYVGVNNGMPGNVLLAFGTD